MCDPPDQVGMASVLSEMIIRGAGNRDSRALSLALDNLGLDRDESVGQFHLRFWGSTLARNIARGNTDLALSKTSMTTSKSPLTNRLRSDR